jgi:mono/diheme cytochrome c family protein
MSRRAVRLLVVPAVLFAVVSGVTFTLAQLHPAKAGEKTEPAGPVGVGDPVSGESLFADNCATCHGEGGAGGGVGPTLAGGEISVDEARTTIEDGSGVMPADLVEGQDLEDVLAYLETIFE